MLCHKGTNLSDAGNLKGSNVLKQVQFFKVKHWDLLLLYSLNGIQMYPKSRLRMQFLLVMSAVIVLVVQKAYGKKIRDYPILVTETLAIRKSPHAGKVIQRH